MNSFWAISAFVCLAQISSRTSRSRRVSPSGCLRVVVRGPAGIDRMASRRIFCRVSRTVANAPRSMKVHSALRSEVSSADPSKASAAS
jgi:hypothetical protein